ncbi:MAG: hypothetical protein IPM37_15840 [Hahellaceae bacterium]|nr:hypothetical protein [Hahellaceae bacterium]
MSSHLPEPPRIKTLICLSTHQEVTNLLPIAASKARRVICLQSAVAHKQNWVEKLRHAMALIDPMVEIQTLLLPEALESNPSGMVEHLEKALKHDLLDAPAFAWGGGLKIQSMALWLLFERIAHRHPERNPVALYFELNQGQLLCWLKPDEAPVAIRQAPILLEPRLASYGFRSIADDTMLRLYRRGCDEPAFPDWLPQAFHLFMHCQDYRRVCFQQAASISSELGVNMGERGEPTLDEILELLQSLWRKGLPSQSFESVYKQLYLDKSNRSLFGPNITRPVWPGIRVTNELRKQLLSTTEANLRECLQLTLELPETLEVRKFIFACNPELSVQSRPKAGQLFLAPGIKDFGRLFELLVGYRAYLWMKRHHSGVIEAYSNLKCQAFHSVDIQGEFDLLVLGENGAMLSVDAKSFSVESQLRKAQQARFTDVSGVIGKFFFCFPMFKEDIDRSSANQEGITQHPQPWYPKSLFNQIQKARKDREARRREALPLVAFDESDAFEQLLAKIILRSVATA